MAAGKDHCVHCEYELATPLAERLRQRDEGTAPHL
jgi:hypothetical protein